MFFFLFNCIFFEQMMEKLKLSMTVLQQNDDDLKALVSSVNPVRLRNNPVLLAAEDFEILYKEIVHES